MMRLRSRSRSAGLFMTGASSGRQRSRRAGQHLLMELTHVAFQNSDQLLLSFFYYYSFSKFKPLKSLHSADLNLIKLDFI